jgi:hypothetical protein
MLSRGVQPLSLKGHRDNQNPVGDLGIGVIPCHFMMDAYRPSKQDIFLSGLPVGVFGETVSRRRTQLNTTGLLFIGSVHGAAIWQRGRGRRWTAEKAYVARALNAAI